MNNRVQSPFISIQLLQSHLVVAAIGSVALIGALLVVLLLGSDINELHDEQIPLERTSIRLMSGVETSLSALRGWVSLEDERFLDQWQHTWEFQIRPEFEQIKKLRTSIASEQGRSALDQLGWQLSDLEESQWWVKSVAQTPGNQPAQVLFNQKVEPLAQKINKSLQAWQFSLHEQDQQSSDQLLEIVNSVQIGFQSLWLNIERSITHGVGLSSSEYRRAFENLKKRIRLAEVLIEGETPIYLRIVKNELTAIEILAEEVLTIRASDRWNRAQHLMATETIPIAEKVLAIVKFLSREAVENMNSKIDDSEQQVAWTTWMMVVLISLVFITAVAFARHRSNNLAEPITSLAGSVKAFAEGRLEHDVSIRGNHEIESLANSFNQMRRQLSHSRKQLEKANQRLEDRVHSRTQQLHLANERLQDSDERLRLSATVFEHSVEGIVITDPEGNIVDVNRAFSDILGYSRDEVVGQTPRLWRSGRHDKEFFRGMWTSLIETGQWRGELWNRRKDGSVFPEWLTINDVRDEQDGLTHYIGIFSDISHIKKSQEQIDFLAHHDPLTELPNRLLFHERLEHAIHHSSRHGSQLAVVFVDLDRFKQVNDGLDHVHGDQLLQKVAKRLSKITRSDDTLARIGGDEFIILLEAIDKSEAVGLTVQKISSAFDEPFDLQENEIDITASIGIAIYPRDGDDAETLIRNSDTAMYRAKELGRNNYQFYTEALTLNTLQRVALESNLRRALERDELSLVYQPQVDLTSGAITGAEALLRWHNKQFGHVSPARFIPLAEETGLIHSIGKWVLNMACRQAVQWVNSGVDLKHIAVNVAGQQIQRGELVNDVTQALANSGLAPERLELEVTESFIMEDPEFAIQQLSILREIGVTMSIDDFGTGYSSLSYLKRLPVTKLKIDQSFVRDIPDDRDDMAITDAVIAMGQSLGLKVIAEGVETDVQKDFLIEHGCINGQGFLFSKPITAKEFEHYFTESV